MVHLQICQGYLKFDHQSMVMNKCFFYYVKKPSCKFRFLFEELNSPYSGGEEKGPSCQFSTVTFSNMGISSQNFLTFVFSALPHYPLPTHPYSRAAPKRPILDWVKSFWRFWFALEYFVIVPCSWVVLNLNNFISFNS